MSAAQYGQPSYWDERYTKDPEPFDWYQRFEGIKHVISQHCKPESKILVIGCGNSRLSEDMYDHGFQNIVNTDISDVAIAQMQERCKEKPGLVWKKMDARKLEYADGFFDAVIDKGTMDSILCGEGSTKNVDSMCREISRVLRSGGAYVLITYGQPDFRMSYLDPKENNEASRYNWNISQHTVPKPTVNEADQDPSDVHYIYVCTKK